MSIADQLDTIHDQICNHFNMINNFDARVRDILQNYTHLFNSLNVLYEQQDGLRSRFRNDQLNSEVYRRRRRFSSQSYRYTPWRYIDSTTNRPDETSFSRLFHSLNDVSDNSVFTISGVMLDLSGIMMNDLSNNFFTPVIIRPSESEIENSTVSTIYNASLYNQNTDPIDQIPFEEGEALTCIIHCNHIFRPENIHRWFNSSVLCPLCRHDIRETIVN